MSEHVFFEDYLGDSEIFLLNYHNAEMCIRLAAESANAALKACKKIDVNSLNEVDAENLMRRLDALSSIHSDLEEYRSAVIDRLFGIRFGWMNTK